MLGQYSDSYTNPTTALRTLSLPLSQPIEDAINRLMHFETWDTPPGLVSVLPNDFVRIAIGDLMPIIGYECPPPGGRNNKQFWHGIKAVAAAAISIGLKNIKAQGIYKMVILK